MEGSALGRIQGAALPHSGRLELLFIAHPTTWSTLEPLETNCVFRTITVSQNKGQEIHL